MAGCHMRFPQNVFGERFLKCSQEELQEKLPSMVSVQMGWSSVKLISVMVMAGNKSDAEATMAVAAQSQAQPAEVARNTVGNNRTPFQFG
ncbi:unnamed protein product [Spirodela intermedia]|uniref:Uncharacterized protein n=1 Tax=Spirodela intermedia TaxID=51605 RepID=A0A7I8KQT8_SPIIN|nr:unnamed protein product [Spirodela intermedia]